MKPLHTLIVSGTSLAIVAAAIPSIPAQLLNAAVATAWAQQDRGRGDRDKDREEDRDNDRGGGRDNERDDRDNDRGGGGRDNEREDRDNDRGGGGGSEREDRDNDRGGGGRDNEREDRDNDRGGGGGSEREDRDNDRGGGGDNEREDRDNDRGGGDNEREDRDSDRGGGDNEREDRDSDRGGGGDNEREDRDSDRGGGSASDERESDRGGNDDRADRDDDRGGSAGNDDRAGDNEDSDDRNANNDDRGAAGNNTGGADVDLPDRSADPADRVTADDRDQDRDTGDLAQRFDLEDSETFDNDGYLARRGEIIAMSADTLLRRRAEGLGLEVVQQEFLASLNTTMYRISVPAASPIDGILARLRAQDPEGVFDRNHLYDRSASPSTTTTSASAASSRALLGTAKGITVGLIDTGVDALHPALQGTHVELQYFVDQSRELPEAHGTAVVSLLVSPEYGILPEAQLYVACVFYEDRRGGSLSEARDLVRALDWLMKRRVPVINMSLSGPPNAVLHAAIKRAIDAGHLIVAAVGNGGPASPPLYPAAYDGVIAVTAVDGSQHVYRRASRGTHVELAAMGVDVVAAAPAGTATYSGTSFASPYVAALAALEYRSLDPQKALEVKESLRANAVDLGKPGRDDVYGFGLARPRAISTVAR